LGAVERSSLGEGARRVAPLVLPAAAFAVSFGVLAEAAGMGRLAPIVMSITTFAGSAQFAAASIVDEDGAVAAAIAAAVFLNMRYAPIAISVAPLFRGPLWRRVLEAQLVVDESWAISNRGGGRFDLGLLLGAGLMLYPVWVLGTVVGVLAGDLLGDPERLGLDAAVPALFLALLIPLLRTRVSIAAALGGAAVALALVPIAPAGIPIVAAAGVCFIGLRRP
jgi:branched chain amino acid efflux pump